MTPKFMTAKGAGLASGQPYYIGHVQHDRAMSKREAYEYLSQRTVLLPPDQLALHIGADNNKKNRKAMKLRIQHERLREEGFTGGIDGIRLQPQIDMVAIRMDERTFLPFCLVHHSLL